MIFTTLLIGILSSEVAYAQQSECAQMLSVIRPISPYIEQVFERADTAIAYARSQPSVEDFDTYLEGWAGQMQTAVSRVVNTQLRLTLAQENIENATACLQIDHMLLECKTEQVMSEINSAMQNGQWGALPMLEDLLSFMQEREVHLLQGALNPTYNDPSWYAEWNFDNPSDPEEEFELAHCPFTSDYLPPDTGVVQNSGFGCTAEVLEQGSRLQHRESQRENDVLQSLLQTLRELQTEIEPFAEFYDIETEQSEESIGHTTVAGCLAGRGVCALNPGIVCTAPVDCTCPEGEQGCGKPGGACIHTTLVGATFWQQQGPFSVRKNTPNTVQRFSTVRSIEGIQRMLPDYLRVETNPAVPLSPIEQLQLQNERGLFQAFSAEQGKLEGITFAESIDPTKRISGSMSKLREVVGEISRIATDEDALRGLAARFASFLRRTCIDRPCNAKLERIIQIAITPECWPYTNGLYLQDQSVIQRANTCLQLLR